MITFTKEQKELLKQLKGHAGYKLLLKCVEEFELGILKKLKIVDTTNENDLKILSKNQNYLEGVEDFILTVDSKTNMIGKRDFDK